MIEVGHSNPSHHENMTENAAKSRHTLRKRGIQYAVASRFHNACSGILDRPPSRATTTESVARSYSLGIAPHSRGAMRPSCAGIIRPWKTEGAGNAGCPMHPQPRAQSVVKHTSVVTTVTPDSPGIPYAMVLTAYLVLSPAT